MGSSSGAASCETETAIESHSSCFLSPTLGVDLEYNLTILIACLAFGGLVIFVALIHWAGDQDGLLRVIVNSAVGAVITLWGLARLAGFIYNLPHKLSMPDAAVLDSIFDQFVVPIVVVLYGWSWLSDPGMGIENQDVDSESLELLEAGKRARDTLPYFVDQARRHIDGAYIRFSLVTDEEPAEHMWGYVHHFENGIFNVSPVNEPYAKKREFGHRRDVPESAVEDWQIILDDGRIKGAHTYIGAFEYLERRDLWLNRALRKQKSLLVDK